MRPFFHSVNQDLQLLFSKGNEIPLDGVFGGFWWLFWLFAGKAALTNLTINLIKLTSQVRFHLHGSYGTNEIPGYFYYGLISVQENCVLPCGSLSANVRNLSN